MVYSIFNNCGKNQVKYLCTSRRQMDTPSLIRPTPINDWIQGEILCKTTSLQALSASIFAISFSSFSSQWCETIFLASSPHFWKMLCHLGPPLDRHWIDNSCSHNELPVPHNVSTSPPTEKVRTRPFAEYTTQGRSFCHGLMVYINQVNFVQPRVADCFCGR